MSSPRKRLGIALIIVTGSNLFYGIFLTSQLPYQLHQDDESNNVIQIEETHISMEDEEGKDLFGDASAMGKSQILPLSESSWQDIKTVQFNNAVEERKLLESLDDAQIHNPPFRRYDDVAIVTKTLWAEDLSHMKKMLCLLKASYNRFVNYDIIVFTTMSWTQDQVEELGKVVAPAKLTVTVEGPPLEDQLNAMTKEEVEFLEKRCSVNKTEAPLSWQHYCTEENSRHANNLGYAWQSEFRAFHIWKHPALKDYKWMMWFDMDALNSKTWENDPMELMVKNDLTLMFDQIYGRTKNPLLKDKMLQAYNTSICSHRIEEGHLEAKECKGHDEMDFWQVNGFHHITNMDVYRSERHSNFLKIMVGDYRFSRMWDDQIAVLVPALMEDPSKAWDMRSHNLTQMVAHHGKYDGRKKEQMPHTNKKRWWKEDIRERWPSGAALCDWCWET